MRAIWILGLLIGLLIAAACQAPVEEAPPSPVAAVHCAAVALRSWAEARQLRGAVAPQPDRDAVVSAQVAGRLVRVMFREGDAVKAGAVIAEVELGPLRDSFRQAQAQLTQARAQLQAATSTAVREQHLVERGISARQTFEVAQAAQAQAQGTVALAASQFDVARRNLERASVRAPLAGVVVKLLRREGEVVDGTPATPIMEIADPAALDFFASASAQDLVALKPGQVATIALEAVPGRSFTGKVRAVSPSVDAQSGVGSARIGFDTLEMTLPMGIVGAADVTVGPKRAAHVVPESAIRSAGGTHTEVVICDAGHARPVAVVTGVRRDGWVEIVSGLEGMAEPIRVATDGLTGLEEGMAIEETP